MNTLGLYRFSGEVGHDVNVGVVETFDPGGSEAIVCLRYAPVIVDGLAL